MEVVYPRRFDPSRTVLLSNSLERAFKVNFLRCVTHPVMRYLGKQEDINVFTTRTSFIDDPERLVDRRFIDAIDNNLTHLLNPHTAFTQKKVVELQNQSNALIVNLLNIKNDFGSKVSIYLPADFWISLTNRVDGKFFFMIPTNFEDEKEKTSILVSEWTADWQSIYNFDRDAIFSYNLLLPDRRPRGTIHTLVVDFKQK